MRIPILVATLMAALAAPALAGTYPVSGKWGQSSAADNGPIDCKGKRIIDFKGDQRTDSGGGVPAYRNRSVTPSGASNFRVVDVFSTGQINNANAYYTLRKVDADRIELIMRQGGTLKLQRCK